MSSYSEGQIHHLANALEAAGFTRENVTKLGTSKEILIGILNVFRGSHEIKPIEEAVWTRFRVDRNLEIPKELNYPELYNTGPAEFNICQVKQWLHDLQKEGKWVNGEEIYELLEKTGVLKRHLGQPELEAIAKKGIAFFEKYFDRENQYYGWRTAGRQSNREWGVPVMGLGMNGVIVGFKAYRFAIPPNGVALYFEDQ